MTASMPFDFVVYTVVISTVLTAALGAVVGALYLIRRWWRRRNRDVYAERKRWNAEQGRRDGYVSAEVDVAAIRALLAHRDGKTRQDGER